MTNSSKTQFLKDISTAVKGRDGGLIKAEITPQDWAKQTSVTREKSRSPSANKTSNIEKLTKILEGQSATIYHLESASKVPSQIANCAKNWAKRTQNSNDPALDAGEETDPIEIACGDNSLLKELIKGNEAMLNNDTIKLVSWPTQPLLSEGDALISLTIADAAASETGTLFMLSSNENPTPLNFLSACHIVLLPSDKICETYEEAYHSSLSHSAKNNIPRTINMISGPSRTADIEQALTLGAHGPMELNVLIYDE